MKEKPEANSPAGKQYKQLLDAFGAATKPAHASVAHLVSLGFSQGQARNAVYRYRTRLDKPT